jgi:hypothetical protein
MHTSLALASPPPMHSAWRRNEAQVLRVVPVNRASDYTPGFVDRSAEICHEMLRNGSADVWLEDRVIQQRYVLDGRHCDELALVDAISLQPTAYAYALRRELEGVARAISLALNVLTQHDAREYDALLSRHLAAGRACPPRTIGDTTPVGLLSMSGVFLIFGAAALGGLLLAAGQAGKATAKVVATPVADGATGGGQQDRTRTDTSMLSESEMLRMLLEKVDAVQAEQQRAAGLSEVE